MKQFVHKEAVFEFMRDKLGLQWSDDFQGSIWVHEDRIGPGIHPDDVGVAVAWHGFIGRMCFINIVIQDKRCFTREVLRECFRYPFKEAGRNVVLALVDSLNKESMDLCERVGFEMSTVWPGGGLTGDMVVWEMHEDRCPWLKEKGNG